MVTLPTEYRQHGLESFMAFMGPCTTPFLLLTGYITLGDRYTIQIPLMVLG